METPAAVDGLHLQSYCICVTDGKRDGGGRGGGVKRVCVCVGVGRVGAGGASCWGVKSPLLFVTVDSAWLSEGPAWILQQRPLGASHCASARQ